MPYFFDIQKQEVIFSRFEYTPQVMDGEWVSLPDERTVYAIKDGKAIFEGDPEDAPEPYDKLILKSKGSLPVYIPEKTQVTIVNDSPSEQTKKQESLLEYLTKELEDLKAKQVTTSEASDSHTKLMKSLEGQITTLTTSLSGAPSQKTIEQEAAIKFLKDELTKLKDNGPTVIKTDDGNQAKVLDALASNFTKLTDLVDTKNTDKEPSEQTKAQQALIEDLQTKLKALEDTDSSDTLTTLTAQQELITSLEAKIDSIIIPETGEPSDLTKQQESTITLLKKELGDLRNEVKGDLVGSLNNQIDSLTTLIGNNIAQGTAAPGSTEVVVQDAGTKDLLKYLKDDLVWNIVNMKSEIEKLKDGTETDKAAKVDELSKYLDTLTASLADKVNTTPAKSTPTSTQVPTPAKTSTGKLTDGFFVFDDSSAPLYSFQSSSQKAKA